MSDEAARERARDEFIVVYVSDRGRGVVRSEEEYRRVFPGHEDVISVEWRRLEDHFSVRREAPDRGAAGAPGRPAGPRPLGRYRIERELGHGAQGTVFLALDTQLGRRVALKVLKIAWSRSTAIVNRFEREARALARLDHPGIAAVHDVGSAHGLEYFAMRFVEGRTLAEEIAARTPATPSARPDHEGLVRHVKIIEKCARALHAAHEAGLVHRDVKPGNIMVGPADEPVVLDFGLARFLDPETRKLTVTGDVLGTPEFMAPEQVAGDLASIDRRTDIYALAAVLRTITAGRRGRNRAVSRDLDAVLEVACDPDPDRRYATAAAFADDLARVRRGAPPDVRPPGRARKLVRWARRAPSTAAMVFLPPVALLCGLIALSVKNQEIRTAAHALEAREAEADAAAQKAIDRFADFRRLEDLRLVQDLEERERDLWPSHPATAVNLKRWLADADDLLRRLSSHRAALTALRGSGRAAAVRERGIDPAADRLLHCELVRDAAEAELLALREGDPRRASMTEIVAKAAKEAEQVERAASSRPSWRFDRVEDQWLHDNLAGLVTRLESLDAPADHGCTRTSVRRRLATALSLERLSLLDPAAAWRDAVASIASPETDPAYGGLRIEPILGLVPLGRDPRSRLWEFAHLLSGTAPVRSAAGNLAITEESAIVLVLVPGGVVRMGARPPLDEGEHWRDHVDPAALPQEQPLHEVSLDPFLISKYEMTQGQWLRATGSNPSHGRPDRSSSKGGHRPTLRHPVELVSFEDCADVLESYGLELPTEAQWERAARAGTTTPWWPGETVESFLAMENLADRAFNETLLAGLPHDAERFDGWSFVSPVGSYSANPFGLHDTIGNLAEWCRDRIEFYKVPALPGDGLRAGGLAHARAIRGGAFNMMARLARSSSRRGMVETTRHEWLGVRPSLQVVRP